LSHETCLLLQLASVLLEKPGCTIREGSVRYIARFGIATEASIFPKTRGGGNKKIRDQPRALEPTLSKEIELGPESVGRLSICENHSANQARR
jgi:hypothetical protein